MYSFPTVTEIKITIKKLQQLSLGHVQSFTSARVLVTSLWLQRHVRGTTNLEKTHAALILAGPKITL